MDEKRRVPKLRFPEFPEAWEQRKFGEITTLKSASRVHKEEWESEGVPFYRSSDVMSAINGTQNEKAFISKELYEKLSAVSGKLEEGDILVTGGGSVGNPYIVPNNDPLYTKDADLLWIKNQGRFDAYFVYEFFFSPTFRDYIGSISHVGTIAHYTISQLSETPIFLPTLDEQKQIGNYFRNLDNLITLHQRKLNEIKQYKKGMLQKMFPQKGEVVPEIRFPDFTDSWEQRKVGDLFSFINKKNTDGAIDNVITNSAEYGLIPQRDFFDKDIAVEGHTYNYTIIDTGDFVYNPRKSNSAPFGPFNCYKLKDKGIVSPLYTCLTLNSMDSAEYLLWYFKTDRWHNFIKSNGAQGGARHDRVGMTNGLMRDIPVWLPSIDEQRAIASHLENFENLITLHQRKLEAIQEYKKGLLQQMFV